VLALILGIIGLERDNFFITIEHGLKRIWTDQYGLFWIETANGREWR
jgi:hypothetical protein